MGKHDDDTRPAGMPERKRKALDELAIMKRFHVLITRRLLALSPDAQERVRSWVRAQLQ